MKRPTLACAHRGLSAEEPENTIAAFRAAADAGAHAMELDVRLSHDGHVIVMHDANIARTTDGVGRVGDLDLKELQTHHTADGPIPTLDEVFTALADWKGVWNIELKQRKVADATLDLVEKHSLVDRTILTSMDPKALTFLRKEDPLVERGLIALGPPDKEDLAAAVDSGCTWMMIHEEYVEAAIVQEVQAVGSRVGAWTVNDVDRAKELIGMGVHMVITDTRDVLEACRK